MNPLLALQAGLPVARPDLLTVAELAVYAFVVAGAISLAYRWYFNVTVSKAIAVLFGVAAVAAVLQASSLGGIISGNLELFELNRVVVNVVAVGTSIGTSLLGWRVGDSFATNVFAVTGVKEFEGEVSRVVRSVGRVTTVTLPDEVADMDEHDTVSDTKKAEMAGKTLLFPRRLTAEELRDRLATRLKDDYGVGYVDAEVNEDGTVEYLAVGSRMTGIGPTLTPGAAAVAVTADPATNASPGDLVQVWSDAGTPERLVTAELRATADDVATLAVDAADASKLRADESYRLLTLPAEPQTDREFAALLRAAEETMGVVTVQEGSTLVGKAVGDIRQTIAAIRPTGGTIEPLPSRTHTLAAGDLLYVIARPEALRKLETDAQAQPSSPAVGE